VLRIEKITVLYGKNVIVKVVIRCAVGLMLDKESGDYV